MTSRRTSPTRRPRRTRSTPAPKRRAYRSRSRRRAIALTHPSLIVIGLGAACVGWQMIARGPAARYYISPDTVGLAGLILVLLGACGYWMECAGMRGRRR